MEVSVITWLSLGVAALTAVFWFLFCKTSIAERCRGHRRSGSSDTTTGIETSNVDTVRMMDIRIVAISVLVTNMAVLGKDNRVSLWQLGSPKHERELPSVEFINIVQGPGDSVLLTGV